MYTLTCHAAQRPSRQHVLHDKASQLSAQCFQSGRANLPTRCGKWNST